MVHSQQGLCSMCQTNIICTVILCISMLWDRLHFSKLQKNNFTLVNEQNTLNRSKITTGTFLLGSLKFLKEL